MLHPKTPYDRPGFLNSTQQHNPNWISSQIFSPTRAVVTGASRMLASVLGFESSYSSSSSECHSSSDVTDDNNDAPGVHNRRCKCAALYALRHAAKGTWIFPLKLIHCMDILDNSNDHNDLRGCLSCSFVGHQREPQLLAGKNETKHLIEQLLMQDSFSREECDKLTNIIKSRAMDYPIIRGLALGRLNETPKITARLFWRQESGQRKEVRIKF